MQHQFNYANGVIASLFNQVGELSIILSRQHLSHLARVPGALVQLGDRMLAAQDVRELWLFQVDQRRRVGQIEPFVDGAFERGGQRPISAQAFAAKLDGPARLAPE